VLTDAAGIRTYIGSVVTAGVAGLRLEGMMDVAWDEDRIRDEMRF
jgi:hypothetical protein